jgi:hypothetical protein
VNARALVAALVGIGTLQMAGDLLGSPALKAIGAATGASPAPKVFTNQNGIETFSARFWLEWVDVGGAAHSTAITPHNYAGLRGPYNRRNTYGAAVAGAPWLSDDPRTAPMWTSVTRHALCGDAPLLRELGLDPAQMQSTPTLRVVLQVAPDDPARRWPLEFTADCHA